MGGVRGASVFELESNVRDGLVSQVVNPFVVVHADVVDRGHPAYYVCDVDGTYLVTVAKVSGAVIGNVPVE